MWTKQLGQGCFKGMLNQLQADSFGLFIVRLNIDKQIKCFNSGSVMFMQK